MRLEETYCRSRERFIMTSEPEILLVTASNATVLDRVAADVFDGPIDRRWTTEFMADARHHLFVAVEDGVVVGMVSAVHYSTGGSISVTLVREATPTYVRCATPPSECVPPPA